MPGAALAAPVITGGPTGPTSNPRPSFTFNDDSFLGAPTCSIDDATPNGGCTTNGTYTSPQLGDGNHIFYVEGHTLFGSTGVVIALVKR